MTQFLSLAGDFNTIQQPNDGQRQQENAVAVRSVRHHKIRSLPADLRLTLAAIPGAEHQNAREMDGAAPPAQNQ